MNEIENLKRDLEYDISLNLKLQNIIGGKQKLIFAIIPLLNSIILLYFFENLRAWLVSSFILWGLYILYPSFIRPFFSKRNKNVKKFKIKIVIKGWKVIYQALKPFLEGIAVFFIFNLIILFITNVPNKIFLIFVSGINVLVAIFYPFLKKHFIEGISFMVKTFYFKKTSKIQYKKNKIIILILFLFVVILILFYCFILPLILFCISYQIILLFKISYSIILILLPIQFITLYFLISYCSERNSLIFLKSQLINYNKIRNKIQLNKIGGKEFKKIKSKYLEQKNINLEYKPFLGMDIWVPIKRED